MAGYYEPKIKTRINLKRRIHKQPALWRVQGLHWGKGIDAGLLSEKDTLRPSFLWKQRGFLRPMRQCARDSFVQEKDLMVSSSLCFPRFTNSPFSLSLKGGGEFLNGYVHRQQLLLCIKPLNITATWWPFTNSFRLWSALGSRETHWLQARHDNPEQRTVTASFMNNGTSTSTIHLSHRKTMASHKISSQKEAIITASKMSYLFLTLLQDECHNKINFHKLLCVCPLASSYPRLGSGQWWPACSQCGQNQPQHFLISERLSWR